MVVRVVPPVRRRAVGRTALLWLWFATSSAAFVVVRGLVVPLRRRSDTTASLLRRRRSLSSLMGGGGGSLDYEYLPPEPKLSAAADGDGDPFSRLPSSFPDGTPAGLRGEAVRAGLRSRCVGWQQSWHEEESSSTSTAAAAGGGGVVRVRGPGALPFLHSKLTQSFVAPTTENDDGVGGGGDNYNYNSYREACLLTPKGRVVDRIGVAVLSNEEAYLLPSAGHAARALFDRLDPYIFPLDRVTLRCLDDGGNDNNNTTTFAFSLASVHRSHLQRCWDDCWMRPQLRDVWKRTSGDADGSSVVGAASTKLPDPDQCLRLPLPDDNDDDDNDDNDSILLIVPTSGLPSHAGGAAGCTFHFLGSPAVARAGEAVWKFLTDGSGGDGDDDPATPRVVAAGPREFEALRIEAGQPAFGREMTGAAEKNSEQGGGAAAAVASATPLELHLLDSTVDLHKGCYLGQEGVASQCKNPRGPPRTLYQVVFDDALNLYTEQSRGEATAPGRRRVANQTRRPAPGDSLYVLGSNERIAVGRVTSVAEPGGTGEPATRALALVRRADSVLKQMRRLGLELPSPSPPSADAEAGDDPDGNRGSGVIQPPPPGRDPLDGLEVIVGGTFTVGRLETVPIRRRRPNMFDEAVPDFAKDLPGEDEPKDIVDVSARTDIAGGDDDGAAARKAAEAAEAEAAAEAQRKAEKMEMLQKRAEEALARRKKQAKKQ